MADVDDRIRPAHATEPSDAASLDLRDALARLDSTERSLLAWRRSSGGCGPIADVCRVLGRTARGVRATLPMLPTEAPGLTVRAAYDIASGALTGLTIEHGVSVTTLELVSTD